MRIFLKVVVLLFYRPYVQSAAGSTTPFNILAVFDEKDEQLWKAVEDEVNQQNLELEKALGRNQSASCVFRLRIFTLRINNSLSPLQCLQTLNAALEEYNYCSILFAASSTPGIGKLIVEYALAKEIPVINATAKVTSLASEGIVSFGFGEDAHQKASMLADILKELSLRKFVVIYDSTFESFRVAKVLHHLTKYRNLLLMKEILISSSTSSLNYLHQLLASLKIKGCQSVIVLSDSVLFIRNLFNLLKSLLELKKLLSTNLTLEQLSGDDLSSNVVIVHPPKNKWTQREVVIDSVTLINIALRHLSSHQQSRDRNNTPSCDNRCPGDFFRPLIAAKFQGKSGFVKFNSDGRRRRTFIEIHKSVRTNEGMIWKNIGHWNGTKSVIIEENLLPLVRVILSESTPSVMAFPKLPQEDCQSSALRCYKNVVTPRGTTETQIKCCRGYAIDVLRLLENDVGFISDLRLSDDGHFGVYNAINDSWNGIVSELVKNKADMSADLFVSSRRAKAVKFTEAYMGAGISLLVRQRKLGSATISWLSYLRPFSTDVWITLLGALSVMVLFLWATESFYFKYSRFIKNEKNQKSSNKNDWTEIDSSNDHLGSSNNDSTTRLSSNFIKKSVFDLETSLFYTMAVACQRPFDYSKPNTNGTRLVALSFSIAMLVFVSAYSANLVRYLIVDDTFLPVTDIRDKKFQHPPPGFRYGTIRGTYTEDFFRNSQNMFFQALWYHMKPNNVETLEEGLLKLHSGSLDVLISDNIALVYASLHDQKCELKVVGQTFGMSGASVAVRKDSIWFAPIADVLANLKGNGLTDYIQDLYIKNDQCQKKIHPPQQLYLTDVSGLFLQLCFAAAFCVLAMFVCICFGIRFHHSKKETKRTRLTMQEDQAN